MLILITLALLEYNPRYFPDPTAYKPSRWYAQESSNEPDAFTAFSIGRFHLISSALSIHTEATAGPRACIGRKFATTEAVCFLALFLRDWRVDIVLEHGETREQWRERVLKAEMIMTLSVGDVPIKLTRRRKI